MISDQSGLPVGIGRYKGNLHAHSTISDGRLTPAEVVADYQAHGYQFLCLSEHDVFTDLSGEFDDEDFILLPGIEASAYLFADDSCDRHARMRCHHMHGILGTDEMVAAAPTRFEHMERLEPLVCHGGWDGLSVARALRDELTRRGCAVMYNHPIWSRIEPEDVLGLDGIFGIEVFNYDTVNEGGDGADTVYWDLLLRRGVAVGGIASDDSHHVVDFDDVFGGWVVVCAESLTRDAIVRALMAGEYYSSSGPAIEGFGVREGVLWIDCSPCERVTMVAGGPIGGNRTVIAPAGDAIEHAEFKLSGCESYVRLECTDASGKTAWTNALR